MVRRAESGGGARELIEGARVSPSVVGGCQIANRAHDRNDGRFVETGITQCGDPGISIEGAALTAGLPQRWSTLLRRALGVPGGAEAPTGGLRGRGGFGPEGVHWRLKPVRDDRQTTQGMVAAADDGVRVGGHGAFCGGCSKDRNRCRSGRTGRLRAGFQETGPPRLKASLHPTIMSRIVSRGIS